MSPTNSSPRHKSYRMANTVVVLTFILGAIFIGFYQLTVHGIGLAWMGWISLLYLLIPPLARKIFRLRPAYLIDMVLYIFIFFAFDLGVALKLYARFQTMDLIAHILSGFVFAEIGLCIYFYLRADKQQPMGYGRGLACIFSFFFTGFVAVVWEIIEYVGFLLTGHDSQCVAATGVGDTMEDMIVCLVGGLVMCLLMFVHLKGKHKLFLFAPSDEFFRVNCAPKEDHA